MAIETLGHRAAAGAHEALDGIHGPLAEFDALGAVGAAHAGAGRELDAASAGSIERQGGTQFLGQPHDRAPLRGLIEATGPQGRLRQFGAAVASHRQELLRQAVAQGDRAGLIEDEGVHIAAGLHRPPGGGDHVELGHPVHAGDADGAEQTADRGGNQGHQQGHQGHGRGGLIEKPGYRREGGHGDQEHLGEHRQQDGEGDLVRCFAALGPLHQGDHAVDEALARIGADPQGELVGKDAGATGDRARHIGSGLLEHRSRFTGDRRFVHRGHPIDHLAIGGDHITGLHQHQIALAQGGGVDQINRAIGQLAPRLGTGLGAAQGIGLGLATAFLQGLGEVGEQQGGEQGEADQGVEAPIRRWDPRIEKVRNQGEQ